MLNVNNPKELLKMQIKNKPDVQLGDLVEFENETYKVVELRGQALHLKRTAFPFDSFLVSNDAVALANKE